MITKDNWMTSETLKDTRDRMIGTGITDIVSYPKIGELFNGVTPSVTIFNIENGFKGATSFTQIIDNKITSQYASVITPGQIITLRRYVAILLFRA